MTTAATPAVVRTATPDDRVLLRDVEDLHDVDLDLLLADRLAESAGALRAVVEAADLARGIAAPAALAAHELGAAARLLAS